MHCGVMVTGYNQGDWERLLAEDYSRPPAVSWNPVRLASEISMLDILLKGRRLHRIPAAFAWTEVAMQPATRARRGRRARDRGRHAALTPCAA